MRADVYGVTDSSTVPQHEPSPVRPAENGPVGRYAAPRPGLARRAGRPLKRMYRGASSGRRVLPNVLIIGAQKAGTSSLYEYLTAHPAVARASTKEVHFFDLAFARGVGWYRRHFPTASQVGRQRAETGLEPVVCEATPYYLFHPQVPYRVRGSLGGARLIVLLRDPVERAISHYEHSVAMGAEDLPLASAIEREPERLSGEAERLAADPCATSLAHRYHSYLSRGVYADQLAVWLALFPRFHFLILNSHELFREPAATMARVHRFLDLPPQALADYPPYGQRDHAVDPALEEHLRAYFAPHNERLWSLIDEDLGWR
jgi:Sulfotransferase domain